MSSRQTFIGPVNPCFMDIIRSTSGDPHTIIVKLSNMPNLFRVFILFITLPAKIRPTLDSHNLIPRSRIVIIK